MRPAAQVDEIPLPIQGDLLVRGNRRDDLGLVLLAHAAEELHGFVAGHDRPFDRDVALRDLGHALLDGGEIFGRERPLVREVVVEAVLDHRADRHLRLGKKLFYRMRQKMRRRMTNDLETVGVLVRDDRNARIRRDRIGGIDELAVHPSGECRLGKAGTDRRGHVGDGHRLVERTDGSVRKADLRHHLILPSFDAITPPLAVHDAIARASASQPLNKKCGRAALVVLVT